MSNKNALFKKMIIKNDNVLFRNKTYPLKTFEEKVSGNPTGYKITWTQDWAKKNKIKEKLVYNNQTLWYFMNYILEWGAIILKEAPYLGEVLYWIDLTENIITSLKPAEVEIDIKNKLIKEVMTRTFKKHNIKIIDETKYTPKKRSYKKEYYLLKVRLILRSLLKRKIKKTEQTGNVMFLSTDRFADENNEKDYLWGGIIKESNKEKIRNEVLVYDRLWCYFSWKTILKKIRQGDNTKSFIGQYYNKQVFSEMDKVHKFLKTSGKELMDDKKFRASLEYKGVNFFDLVENRFRFIFNAFSYEIGDCIAITKSIIEIKKPKIIMIDHEDNFYGKGFMINCKYKACKIAALQYELVYPGCIASHIKEDNNDKKNPLWRPLPDLKLTGGSYIKDVLIKDCNYPNKGMIKIIGQPRYDDYFKMSKSVTDAQKYRLKKKLGLPSDKKIITYASAQAFVEKESLQLLINIVKQNSSLFLFLKIHPSADEGLYAKMFDIKNERIIAKQAVDLKELLPVTDILTTMGSTVAMEAMIFDVPAILINSEIECAMPYLIYNSVLSAKNEEELLKKIQQVLKDPVIKKQLKKGRERFLKDYLYSKDGKAAERVVDEIKKIYKGVPR